ncbi:presqualene diphosphate synthase HpnD [Plantactinospora siamensis]|uniref:Presqualene diphosphate synthase HpnD n=1 Tax=Plantactinospora siamensis TaxID=555372 RepID=A0ABV6P6E8_9ACTN
MTYRLMSTTTTLAEAYARCAEITRVEARNFYYGIRLLPPDKRAVLCAVYALARRMDDIGDGDLPVEAKVNALAELRTELAALSSSADPVLVAVADAARRYPIPLDAFGELIDGVQMDVTGRRYASFEELVGYCRCVAGAVGRLCLGVFGSRPHPAAARYADQLGIALQQTNILRDIREDLMNGRTYLPQEDLDRFGVELALDEHGALVDRDGGLSAVIRYGCARANDWYREGLRLAPLLDWRSRASCLAMAGIYRQLLTRIEAEPSLVFGQRLSLSGRAKAGVALRSLAGRSAPVGAALAGRSAPRGCRMSERSELIIRLSAEEPHGGSERSEEPS